MHIRAAASMSVSVLVACERDLSPSLEAQWLNDLPPARRAQIGRWPMRRDRHRSLLATRLLLVQLRRLGHSRDALAGLRHQAGARPTLALPVQFSLSHCDGRIAAAVSADGSIGVDVEAVAALQGSDFPHYLNEAERSGCGRSARRFCAVWTRKEAVAKAAGTAGLASLAAIDTSTGPDLAMFAGRLWRTTPLALGTGHVGHLASAECHGDLSVTVEHLAADALL